MLIWSLVLLVASSAIVIAAAASAVLELVLRNYRLALIAALSGLAAAPVVLIAQNLMSLSVALASHS